MNNLMNVKKKDYYEQCHEYEYEQAHEYEYEQAHEYEI